MQFEKNNLSITFLVLFLILCLEVPQALKSSKSLQYEICTRKIDLKKDPPGILRLLPGVGLKKVQEIIELRKTGISQTKIIESLVITKRQKDWNLFLADEVETSTIK